MVLLSFEVTVKPGLLFPNENNRAGVREGAKTKRHVRLKSRNMVHR